jgi:hypothetical protein
MQCQEENCGGVVATEKPVVCQPAGCGQIRLHNCQTCGRLYYNSGPNYHPANNRHEHRLFWKDGKVEARNDKGQVVTEA